MFNLLFLTHSFGNDGDLASFFLSTARVRSIVRPGGRLSDVPDMIREAKEKFPDFRPHFVVLMIGDNDVLNISPRSLSNRLIETMRSAVRSLEAREIWATYLFARGESRWTPNPLLFNARASQVNEDLKHGLRPGLHVIRHQLAASSDRPKNERRVGTGLRGDNTHLNTNGFRMVLTSVRNQLMGAARRHGLEKRGVDRSRRLGDAQNPRRLGGEENPVLV